MNVFVAKRYNGDCNVEGVKIVELPRLRRSPAVVGVQFPGETLIEWFLPSEILQFLPKKTKAALPPSPQIQGELFSL
jgi:hypothetical protein